MEAVVQKALGSTLFTPTGSGGSGCISSGSSYLTDNHGTVFVKVNSLPNAVSMFVGEKCGLEAILATESVKCPKPLRIVQEEDSVALVMESLNLGSINSKQQQQLLGQQLAKMHLHNKTLLDNGDKEDSVVQFGFQVPTSCGYLSQDNTWTDDWTSFYVRQKLQAQVDMLKEDRDLAHIWPLCRQKIETVLSELKDIVPSLLHGDLWSGNIASESGVPVIYDPAAFYGHSEYDFGISHMFGGLTSRGFLEEYFKIIPKAQGFEERADMYELFHHLNHWNHFGSGYKGSTIQLMKKIIDGNLRK